MYTQLARVGVRDLRANVAALVRRAASGERVVITSDGVPVAVLGPLSPAADGVTMDDLVAAGLVVPPGRGDRPSAPEPASLPIDTRSSRVLDELRGLVVTVFLDTSALVQRYVDEPGRDLVVDAMAEDPTWVASALARTEVMVTLHQLAAGPRQQARLWSAFRDDWDAFAVVPVDDRCLGRALELGSSFSMRIVDALHLAAADRLPRPAKYVTFDRHQIPAAAALGFEVVSPLADKIDPMAKKDEGESETIEVAGREFTVTNTTKVFFEERGETKLDLVRFYLRVGDGVMRSMRNRPTMLQRFPHGATGESFFQKRVPKNVPDWLQTTTVSTVNGTTSEALVIADLAHIVWAVNLGCLGFHPWPFTVDDEAHADELRIDLDPQPGTDFVKIREAAHEVHAFFEELGVAADPNDAGNRGLHVYAQLRPRWDSYDVRAAAVAVAREMERRRPDLLTWAWWKEERGERIYVDYNQDAPHKTVFGAWSVRSRAGAQVSTPLRWDEIDDVHPDDLTIPVVAERFERDGDPWQGIDEDLQSIEPLLEMSARDLANGVMDAPWPPVYPKMPNEPPRVAPSRAKQED